MKHTTYTYTPEELGISAESLPDSGTLLFDIETTGLSAKREPVYCIGLGYQKDSMAVVELIFADTPDDEKEILELFSKRLSDFTEIMSFNGTTFDLPFLKTRYEKHQLSHTLESFPHRDLFREIHKMKKLLQLDSYKQKSVELWLNRSREDLYTGGELIQIYHEYCFSQDEEKLKLLLLHNHDDIKGMFYLPSALSYKSLSEGAYTLSDISFEQMNDQVYLNLKLLPEQTLPASFLRKYDEATVAFRPECILLQMPVYCGELKHFFDNYKDYYYIPSENTVMHKSVAQFMDASLRKKATRQNCFVSKHCHYVTLPAKQCDCPLRTECKEKANYCEIDLNQEIISEETKAELRAMVQAFFASLL